MDFENFKWWHWLLISLPIGWVLAYANSSPVQPTDTRTDRETTFESAILRAPFGTEKIPWVRNLVVYPPTEAKGPGNSSISIMPVTYEVLQPKVGGGPGEYEYMASYFAARLPFSAMNRPAIDGEGKAIRLSDGQLPVGIERTFVPDEDATLQSITAAVFGKDTIEGQELLKMANPNTLARNESIATLIKGNYFTAGQSILVPWAPDEHKTVRDWLDSAKQRYTWVNYRFAWWKVPRNCQILWMAISVAVIGTFFPMMVNLMTGAGLGRRREVKSDYDLSRFGSGPSKAVAKMPAKAAAEMGDKGREQLAALNASLTSSLAEGAVDGGSQPAAPAAAAKAPAAQKPLATEEVQPLPQEKKVETFKEYAGEFYPVVRASSEHPDAAKAPPATDSKANPKPPESKKP